MAVYQYDREKELVKPLKKRRGEYRYLLQNPCILEQICSQVSENGIVAGEVFSDNPYGIPLKDKETDKALRKKGSSLVWSYTRDGKLEIYEYIDLEDDDLEDDD